MSEEITEQKPEITVEEVRFSLNEMHEVASGMKQCNPNITPIRAMVLDRWRTILWERLPVVIAFIEQQFPTEKLTEEKPKRIIKLPGKPSRIIKVPKKLVR